MAHELGHFDLHRNLEMDFSPGLPESFFFDGQIPPFLETEEHNIQSVVSPGLLERQANAYSAELLTPKEEILSAIQDLHDPQQVIFHIEPLSHKFQVSFEAMVLRLMELNALRRNTRE